MVDDYNTVPAMRSRRDPYLLANSALITLEGRRQILVQSYSVEQVVPLSNGFESLPEDARQRLRSIFVPYGRTHGFTLTVKPDFPAESDAQASQLE